MVPKFLKFLIFTRCSSYNKKELTYDRTVRDINIDEENNLLRVTFSRCVLWTKLDDCSVHKCTKFVQFLIDIYCKLLFV